MLKEIQNPNIYHGTTKTNNYFEGWYFKLVHPSKNLVYTFIPGISMFSNPHCFIQVLEGHSSSFEYIRYDAQDFTSSKYVFEVCISNNLFSLNKIVLNLTTTNSHIEGSLTLVNHIKWPDSILNPGSMGFYNYLTFMQCFSQVCSMDSNIIGSLIINGETIDFTGGKAYIEKNWGKAFPSSYIWAQCNTFLHKDLSLTCSIGHIPMPIGSFTGFLIGLYTGEKFYKFTTIKRSKIRINTGDTSINIEALNKRYKLNFYLSAPIETFMKLYAPIDSRMQPLVRESLLANVTLQLIDLVDLNENRIILESTGQLGGLEFGGAYELLCTNTNLMVF